MINILILRIAGVPADSGTYQLSTLSWRRWLLLPGLIKIGAFAAKKFGANPALGMANTGGLLIYPSQRRQRRHRAFNFLGIPVRR